MNNDAFDSDPQGEEYSATEFTSKTQLKQASEALKKLGLELVGLTKGEREKMPLDDELDSALEVASKINRKKEGFRRQIQLIGKLLRQRDVAPIRLAIDKLRNAHTHSVKAFHGLERTRDTLIKEGDDAVQALMAEHPQLDRQKLRQLIRTAKKEASEAKPPAASRELFKYLKSEIS
ncbi:ribosome biogenesis factor YjgA [Glaciecola siphonariae]|uniref:Dual-action ribosomal maturation protein DarP n=1 Tax=Glaciecola siphonariae TaxID=521012 RepID=A0ABV9LXX9_9ALTE